jgi:predicted metal-dependent phosphoesterase TrpH
MVNVNTHIHTPCSFSAFGSIEQAAELALNENVRVLGICDFNTIEGFDEFAEACGRHAILPLFNIEFIAFSERDKKEGKRWNDPQNPGVMYYCGKALAHPSTFSDDSRSRLRNLWQGTQDHIWQVIHKLSDYLCGIAVPLALDYNRIRATYTRGTVRERHLARALADALRERYPDPEKLRAVLRDVFADRAAKVDVTDDVALQNELRARLLKAGKPAFVEEDPSAFLSVEEVRRLVLDGGGIPCYPVLADDKRGLGEHESDLDGLTEALKAMKLHAVEFIPTRNSFDHLKRYVMHLRANGFCVTFGTEHNTPELASLVPSARGGAAFDEELQGIAYEGACILAAHQKLKAAGKPGFVGPRGKRLVPPEEMAEFARVGDETIRAATAPKG